MGITTAAEGSAPGCLAVLFHQFVLRHIADAR
jgi:hypothetical protein